MWEILKATLCQRENSFFFGKLLFLTLTNSNSVKGASAIFKIMNINVDNRLFVNASHSVFLEKHQNTNRIKTKNVLENRGDTFVENAIILTCVKI